MPYARLVIALAVVAAALGLYGYVSHLQSKVASLTHELEVCKTNTETLKTAIDHQNEAIDQLKSDADKRAAAAAASIAAAQQQAEKAKAAAAAIFKMKPSNPADLCQSALDLVNGGAK